MGIERRVSHLNYELGRLHVGDQSRRVEELLSQQAGFMTESRRPIVHNFTNHPTPSFDRRQRRESKDETSTPHGTTYAPNRKTRVCHPTVDLARAAAHNIVLLSVESEILLRVPVFPLPIIKTAVKDDPRGQPGLDTTLNPVNFKRIPARWINQSTFSSGMAPPDD